jgi:hypothetical protein
MEGHILNIIVHILFAVTVRRQLKSSLGISLSYPGFLYGNILPDISRKYRKHPHNIKDSLAHVVTSGRKILNLEEKDNISDYTFARELGVINHYLSDFFCFPHNEDYKGSKIMHLIYELIMTVRYKKGLKLFRKMLNQQRDFLNPENLEIFIRDRNEHYKSINSNDVNDIGYALFAGIKLIECMIAHSIFGHKICPGILAAPAH